MDELRKQILSDIRVELTEEFDRNFERKGFFSRPWKPRRNDKDLRGSLMQQTGKLRRSIRARQSDTSVTWSSSEPYAALHNEGGRIMVTRKMQKYFWAKYYELSGKINYKKDGSTARSSMRVSRAAEMYYALALKPVGSYITIPKRQFLGDAPEVQQAVRRVIKQHLNNIPTQLKKHFKQWEVKFTIYWRVSYSQ